MASFEAVEIFTGSNFHGHENLMDYMILTWQGFMENIYMFFKLSQVFILTLLQGESKL